MKTIEESLGKINVYYDWWMDALENQEYQQAETVKKNMLDPEIRKCVDAYIIHEDSDKLIDRYVKILEDKKMPDLKEFAVGPANISSNMILPNNTVGAENIGQKTEQLIRYYDDKIHILKDEEEYNLITDIKDTRRFLIEAYTEYMLEMDASGEKRNVSYPTLIKVYTYALDIIKKHNDRYDSMH